MFLPPFPIPRQLEFLLLTHPEIEIEIGIGGCGCLEGGDAGSWLLDLSSLHM